MSKKTNPSQKETLEEKEPTAQELKAMRDNLAKYYKEQNEVLKVQSEYEKHQADIAENRARQYLNQIRLSQMVHDSKNPPAEVASPRKLKTDA